MALANFSANASAMAPGSFAPQGGEECAGLELRQIPGKIAEHYSLSKMAGCGAAYAKLNKKCGRRRARLRAHKRFGEILHTGGYHEATTKGFYTHKSRGIPLALAYSDLGAKCKGTAGIEHLAKALEPCYRLELEHFSNRYASLALGWGCGARAARCSMPGCAKKVLAGRYGLGDPSWRFEEEQAELRPSLQAEPQRLALAALQQHGSCFALAQR